MQGERMEKKMIHLTNYSSQNHYDTNFIHDFIIEMKEAISLHIGQAGIQLADYVWELFSL